jgi:hypothetical protein
MTNIISFIKNRTNLNACSFIFILVVFSGCAVGMAASGGKKVNTGILEVGQSRLIVESILGRPVARLEDTTEKRTDVYEFEMGDESSTKRAWVHGLMDVLTLTLWEIPASIYEGVQGNMHTMQITYGRDDRVLKVGQVTKGEAKPATVIADQKNEETHKGSKYKMDSYE